MTRSLGHPSSKKLLGEVRSLFRKKKIFYTLRTHVAFVCGGNKKKDLRPRFIEFVNNSKSQIAIFRAENALADLFSDRDPQFINLAELEKLIANVFDSVVIFPESPGSYAELGYFAHDRNIRKRTLIVNSDRFQEDSFLTLGPIATVNQNSLFQPTIILNARDPSPRFTLVVKRLNRFTSRRQYRESFQFSTYQRMSPKDRLFILAELVNIFGAIDFEGLALCTKVVFDTSSKADLRKFLSILCAANFVARDHKQPDFFVPAPKAKRFFEYEHYDIDALRARIVQHYKKYAPECYSALRRAR